MYASDNNKYNDGLCVYTKGLFLVHWNVFKYFTNLRNGKYHDWKLFARKEIQLNNANMQHAMLENREEQMYIEARMFAGRTKNRQAIGQATVIMDGQSNL